MEGYEGIRTFQLWIGSVAFVALLATLGFTSVPWIRTDFSRVLEASYAIGVSLLAALVSVFIVGHLEITTPGLRNQVTASSGFGVFVICIALSFTLLRCVDPLKGQAGVWIYDLKDLKNGDAIRGAMSVKRRGKVLGEALYAESGKRRGTFESHAVARDGDTLYVVYEMNLVDAPPYRGVVRLTVKGEDVMSGSFVELSEAPRYSGTITARRSQHATLAGAVGKLSVS